MKKILLLAVIAISFASCDHRNCDTCLTEESHPNTSEPKTGVVTKIMLNSSGESSQNFVIYFDDHNGVNRNYESKTLSLPGDTITWY